MMTTAMTQVPDDHPLMVAWREYQNSDEFKNSKRWAETVALAQDGGNGDPILSHPYLQGSLWAVFDAGFRAGAAAVRQKGESEEG